MLSALTACVVPLRLIQTDAGVPGHHDASAGVPVRQLRSAGALGHQTPRQSADQSPRDEDPRPDRGPRAR